MKNLHLSLLTASLLGISFSCTPPSPYPSEGRLTPSSSERLFSLTHFRWGTSQSDIHLPIIHSHKNDKNNFAMIRVNSKFCSNDSAVVDLHFINDKLVEVYTKPYSGNDLNGIAAVINREFAYIHEIDPTFTPLYPLLTGEILKNISSNYCLIDSKTKSLICISVPIKTMPRYLHLSVIINFEDPNSLSIDFTIMPA
jgi:hypothetical protein